MINNIVLLPSKVFTDCKLQYLHKQQLAIIVLLKINNWFNVPFTIDPAMLKG